MIKSNKRNEKNLSIFVETKEWTTTTTTNTKLRCRIDRCLHSEWHNRILLIIYRWHWWHSVLWLNITHRLRIIQFGDGCLSSRDQIKHIPISYVSRNVRKPFEIHQLRRHRHYHPCCAFVIAAAIRSQPSGCSPAYPNNRNKNWFWFVPINKMSNQMANDRQFEHTICPFHIENHLVKPHCGKSASMIFKW